MDFSHCSLCGLNTSNSQFTISPLTPNVIDPLLHSNAPLTPHARALVTHHLLHLRMCTATLDKAIQGLQQARVGLEHEHAKHLALISPMRSFPPEILSEIFLVLREVWWKDVREWEYGKEWQLREADSWEKGGRFWNSNGCSFEQVQPPAHVMSRVCRSWRAAAHACSNLWSYIYLNGHSNTATAEALISEQLTLSANQPLHILVSHNIWDISPLECILQRLRQTHLRWSDLSTHFLEDSQDQCPLLLPVTKSPRFPSLTSLNLELHWGILSPIRLSAADVPLLRDVRIHWGDSSELVLDLPWAQLHRLQMDCPNRTQIARIVPNIQAVRELRIVQAELELELNYVERIVCLPYLRCLHLSNDSDHKAGVGGILRFLRLPALRTVIWTQMGPGEERELVDMLKRSSLQGNQASLAEIHLFSPDASLFEGHSPPMLTIIQALLLTVEIFQIEYTSPSGVDFSQVLNQLTVVPREGVPHLRIFKIQGGVIRSTPLHFLLLRIRQQNDLKLSLLDCTIHPKEAYSHAEFLDAMDLLEQPLPSSVQLELDIEGPDHKRLTYTVERGVRIEGLP